MISSEKNHRRFGWLTSTVVMAMLGFFYQAAIFSACSNDDLLVFSMLIGFPLSVFLIFRKRIYGIVWLALPLISFLIGRPYGHNYGSISKSAIFGLEQGSECQSDVWVLVLLGVVAGAAVIDYIIFLGVSKAMKNWLTGILAAIFSSLVVAWITGAWHPLQTAIQIFHGGQERSEQLTLARELAEKYNFFSTGDQPWSRPRNSGFPNQFQESSDTIYDQGTGLTWQREGSGDSMGYSEIDGYLRKLNHKSLGGYNDWRLPSLAEAWSLLEYKQNNAGLHIDPSFSSEQTWIWTKTVTKDKGYGWFIFFESGKPIFQNARDSHAYVRAVRGPEFK